MTVVVAERLGWVSVIAADELPAELGIPALVGNSAVAVVRAWDGVVYAVSNLDPRTGASVMARGIVGSRGDVPTIASPLYKDVFDLRTGRCLEDPTKTLTVFQVRVEEGIVQVRGTDDGGR
ncbi:MAG: nitrite reductase small subunit NirD [Sporichthyaceae bacterium]|jgi:nitrite reductase (NADH) small subunit